ncbi:putative Zn finger-like uncharacterized protein [Paracoccus pantotrophus]|uniref:Zn finger-like uncharacterized protein n=3 Tax=Paracoccaceae TaxID=31989 RepID=A0ABX9SDA5_PARPN|nr:putative Zn finger-like uncharacterized protein [Paracoccus pantotrophus]
MIETIPLPEPKDQPMRLTCPRCAAQYEIAESAIPASGREVECSACGHVWRQPGAGKSAPPAPAAAAAAAPGAYDPQARPVLNRPLDESVLAILREEAARELRAREAPARKSSPDHIPATTPAAAQEAAQDAAQPAAGERRAKAEPPIDWPAVTVTETGSAAAPAEPVAGKEAPANPQMPPVPQQESPAAEAPAARPASPDRPEPVAPALPDAEELAATLTRTGPPRPDAAITAEEPPPAVAPLIRPALPEIPAAATPPATAAATVPREAPVPALVPVRRQRGGYGMGFGLAAMLALGAVILYVLAPQIPAEEGGGWLADWRQQVDQARLWLHDRLLDR